MISRTVTFHNHPGFALNDLVRVNDKSKQHFGKIARVIKFCDLKMKLRTEMDHNNTPATEMEFYCCDCQVEVIKMSPILVPSDSKKPVSSSKTSSFEKKSTMLILSAILGLVESLCSQSDDDGLGLSLKEILQHIIFNL